MCALLLPCLLSRCELEDDILQINLNESSILKSVKLQPLTVLQLNVCSVCDYGELSHYFYWREASKHLFVLDRALTPKQPSQIDFCEWNSLLQLCGGSMNEELLTGVE